MSYVDQLCVPRCDIEEEPQPAIGHGRLRGPADEAERSERESATPWALGMERFGSVTATGAAW
ncbi:MAG: hypothetical protein ACRC20_07480 [Segniliparus sp.]|uniref:hypothetical protein n=1 Tax=Segniliparus sp. TaxID=2804064 RepID=UPI003F2CC6BF